ncbi:DNA polymerase III subunit gamma/tau [Mangrovicella endophytica]|uniref:DNA polymerase III subunit gamma/tau n=1 Tax=Mangrovicella endophytica TaxID=2066697 RepID=UPI003CCA5956
METEALAEALAKPYRVLARKYRPKSFDDLIGQAPMVRTLTNAFDTGRIAQAWMLTGVRGVGKTTTARILARALNFQTDEIGQPTIAMRGLGIHCQAIMEGRHVDVVEMDAASHTGIDDIREIIAQVRYRPVSARYKVYIIDEVHMLSNQAFNGLLKTLEEPPEHAKFVFATTEIRKVPITVLSRCQRFDLRRVDTVTMISHLRGITEAEGVKADDDALRLIARAAEGSVRDALSLTDQAIAHGAGTIDAATVQDMLGLADRVRIIDLFEHLMKGDGAAALAELRAQYTAGADPVVILSDLADFTHLVTMLRYVPDATDDASLSPAEIERGLAFSSKLSVRTLSQVWQMLLKAIEEARAAVSPRQAAEMALIRIAHAADLPAPEDLLRMLRSGEPLPALPSGPVRDAPAVTNGRDGGSSMQSAAAASAAGGAPRAAAAAPRPMAGSSAAPATAAAPAATSLAPRPQLSIAPRSEAAPALAAAPKPAPAGPEVEIGSIAALADLAEEKRDSLMRVSIRRYLRLVSIEPGRIEVALKDGAPRTLPGDLSRRLHDWTGRRWVVSVASSGGAETLEETERNRRDALLSDATSDPEVAAILAAFPGAKVTDVRLRGEAEAVAEAAGATVLPEPAAGELEPDVETAEDEFPDHPGIDPIEDDDEDDEETLS